LTIDERIELTTKEMNKRALEEFMTKGWLHPKFRTFERRKRWRFGGINPAFDADDSENIVEAINDEFPNAK
jgi:hypothetical protein